MYNVIRAQYEFMMYTVQAFMWSVLYGPLVTVLDATAAISNSVVVPVFVDNA